jgi:hypothetical protein
MVRSTPARPALVHPHHALVCGESWSWGRQLAIKAPALKVSSANLLGWQANLFLLGRTFTLALSIIDNSDYNIEGEQVGEETSLMDSWRDTQTNFLVLFGGARGAGKIRGGCEPGAIVATSFISICQHLSCDNHPRIAFAAVRADSVLECTLWVYFRMQRRERTWSGSLRRWRRKCLQRPSARITLLPRATKLGYAIALGRRAVYRGDGNHVQHSRTHHPLVASVSPGSQGKSNQSFRSFVVA